MSTLSDFKFIDVLPSSIVHDENIKSFAAILDKELKKITNSIEQTLVYHRLDDLSGDVLNLLAWQFSVDFFDIKMRDEIKRECIRESIAWHKKKGTKWAVETALLKAGFKGQIHTFHEMDENDNPSINLDHFAKFYLLMDLACLRQKNDWVKEVESIIDISKPVRSKLQGIVTQDQLEANNKGLHNCSLARVANLPEKLSVDDTFKSIIKFKSIVAGNKRQKNIIPLSITTNHSIKTAFFITNKRSVELEIPLVSIAQNTVSTTSKVETGKLTDSGNIKKLFYSGSLGRASCFADKFSGRAASLVQGNKSNIIAHAKEVKDHTFVGKNVNRNTNIFVSFLYHKKEAET